MREKKHSFDFVVIGAGLAGIAAAVTAAREGLSTALVNDRPVLGGNASKEYRTPPIGAHAIDQNFLYYRETGVIEELLLENLKRNPQGNIELWNLQLQDFIKKQSNLSVFLNTAVSQVKMSDVGKRILEVTGLETTSETRHTFEAEYFADCTGNGTVSALAGVPFRRGCEACAEFGESLAPQTAEKREMGSSIRFLAKDTGRPVKFFLPEWNPYRFGKEDFDKRNIEESFRRTKGGFWWIEWGGLKDSVYESAEIGDQLLEIIYAVWDYLKNRSAIREEIASYDLEWIGALPGKRENRRIVGAYTLSQTDIDRQQDYLDTIAYGGWGYDDHSANGFFDREKASTHVFHNRPYHIPLSCLYTEKIGNLFFAGRDISVTHLALTSTRVMMTCAQLGEAVGAAAAVCLRNRAEPGMLMETGLIQKVQNLLCGRDHSILGLPFFQEGDKALHAKISASSTLELTGVTSPAYPFVPKTAEYWMFPVVTGCLDEIRVLMDADSGTVLEYELYGCCDKLGTVPGILLEKDTLSVGSGIGQWAIIPLHIHLHEQGWYFLRVTANKPIRFYQGINSPVGFKSMSEVANPAGGMVAQSNLRWHADSDLKTLPACCMQIFPAQPVYNTDNLTNPWNRPISLPNLWISKSSDFSRPEWLLFEWEIPQKIERVELLFDSSLDSMLSAFQADGNCAIDGYDFDAIPSLVKDYRIMIRRFEEEDWQEIVSVTGNYQRRKTHKFPSVMVCQMKLEITATNGLNRAQIYGVRMF